MRKLILAAGVAALAVTAPAVAKPDKGGGGDRKAQVERGGKAKAQRGGERRAQRIERRGGGKQRVATIERRGGGKAQRLERRGGGERRFAVLQVRDERKARRVENRQRGNRDVARIENRGRGNRDVARIENRGRGKDRIEFESRGRDRREQRVVMDRGQFRDRDVARIRDERVVRVRDWDEDRWDRIFVDRGIPAGFVGGCPPGLAKKSPACIPPGQAKQQFVGRALPAVYASNYLPLALRDIYRDDDDYYYRWGDGYVYRVDRDDQLVAALLPLIGAGLGVGMPFPYTGPSYYVPSYYQSFYPDYGYGGDYYRYANGYVYEIDGDTGLIEDIDPLLDRGYGVGQLLPAGYSYYNVPYQYRTLYYDTPDYYYRYAPGAIYQVDRDTALITAVASLLTGGLSVGQPLPPAYSVYNVPLGYRDMYYDRPDAWYRYSDGYIYQVDPTTQLITAIVRAIV